MNHKLASSSGVSPNKCLMELLSAFFINLVCRAVDCTHEIVNVYTVVPQIMSWLTLTFIQWENFLSRLNTIYFNNIFVYICIFVY